MIRIRRFGWKADVVVVILLHHHFARSAVGITFDDDAALFVVEFSSAQVVVACHARSILFHFQVVYACLHDHNLVCIPRRHRLIECFGFFTHHIDGFQGRVGKEIKTNFGWCCRQHNDRLQGSTILEAIISQRRNRSRNSDGSQTVTVAAFTTYCVSANSI